MTEKNAIFVTLNQGRGSEAVVNSQIDAFQQEGSTVTSISTQPVERPGVDSLEVPLGELPMPIHDYLPGVDNTVPVYSMEEAQAEVYKELFVEGIDTAVREAGSRGVDPVLLVHHANIHLAAAMEVAQEKGVPYICQPHGTCIDGYEKSGRIAAYEAGDPEGNVWGEVREGMDRAAGIIAISKYVQESQINPNVSDPGKVQVVYNQLPPNTYTTVDHSIVPRLIQEGKIEDKPYVLQMSIMAEWKRPHDLAEATHTLPDDVQTLFVGHDAGMAEQTVEQGKNCVHLGPIYGAEAKGLLAGASVLAVSSIIEPFGLTPVEAGSLGVPAVVRPGGAPQEFVKNGLNGYVAEDLSIEAYSEALLRGLTRPTELRGEELSVYTKEQFSYKNTTKKIIDLAHSLAA